MATGYKSNIEFNFHVERNKSHFPLLVVVKHPTAFFLSGYVSFQTHHILNLSFFGHKLDV